MPKARDVSIKLDLDSRQAQRGLQKTAEEARNLDGDLEDVETAGQAVAKAIAKSADDMIDEIDATERAVKALSKELGDVDINPQDAVAGLKKMGLTAEEVEADAEQLADALKQAGKVEVHATTKGFKDLGQAVDGADDAALNSADRYQSLGSSVRGVSDELGLASSGVNSFAIGALDAGDVAVQMGEKFGMSASAAASLGTALGVAGIGAVIVGTAVPALQKLMDSQQEVNEETKNASARIRDQIGILEGYEKLTSERGLVIDALFGDTDEEDQKNLEKFVERFGTTVPEMLDSIKDADGSFEPLLKDLLRTDPAAIALAESFGVTTDAIAKAAAEADSFPDFMDQFLDGAPSSFELTKGLKELFTEIELGQDVVDEIDIAQVFEDQARAIESGSFGKRYAAIFEELKESMPKASDTDLVEEFFLVIEDRAAAAAERMEAAKDEGLYLAEEYEDQVIPAVAGVADEMDGLADVDGPKIMVDAALAQFDRLVSGIDSDVDRLKFERDLEAKFEKVVAAQIKADKDIAEHGWEGATDSVRDYKIEIGEVRSDIARYHTDVLGLPPEVVTELTQDIDTQGLATLMEYYDLLGKGVTMPVRIVGLGSSGINSTFIDANGNAINMPVPLATGGPMQAGGSYLVGEEGPELITPSRSGYVHNADETNDMLAAPRSASGVTNVHINMPAGSKPTDVMHAFRRYERIQGQPV